MRCMIELLPNDFEAVVRRPLDMVLVDDGDCLWEHQLGHRPVALPHVLADHLDTLPTDHGVEVGTQIRLPARRLHVDHQPVRHVANDEAGLPVEVDFVHAEDARQARFVAAENLFRVLVEDAAHQGLMDATSCGRRRERESYGLLRDVLAEPDGDTVFGVDVRQ
jgi:hypothetical protein